jgi:hypothetical protein
MQSFSIPVKLADSFEGFAESKGLLISNDEAILIQFQTVDAILGVVKSGISEVKLPLANLVELSYKKSLFGNKLILKVDNLRLIEKLPECNNNEVVLSIARKDIDDAIDFVRAIKLDMSEKEYQEALKQA